ncbi:MAG: sugar phosphate isomerase/epimerase [Kiritimatiellae bacterium]|nr:sugar phosphate isomerase/epimerase [Kiritimatiellia bacterium]
MKTKTNRIVVAVALVAALAASAPLRAADCGEPRISVFASAVKKLARDRGVTVAAAADMLHSVGVRGFDADARDADLPALAATRLKPANIYFFPDMLGPDNGAADCRFCFDVAERFGAPRVMIVPPNFTEGGDMSAEFGRVVSSMRMFVAEGRRRGITVTVEDFGGEANPCSHVKYLKRLLDEIPGLCFALDSGNLLYAGRGEDILEMMAYAKGRIAHVHLKDQRPENPRRYETLGLGAVPNEKIVKTIAADGYDGWYTLENFVGEVMADAVRQVGVLKLWLSEQAAGAR